MRWAVKIGETFAVLEDGVWIVDRNRQSDLSRSLNILYPPVMGYDYDPLPSQTAAEKAARDLGGEIVERPEIPEFSAETIF